MYDIENHRKEIVIMRDSKIELVNTQGETVTCDVLFTFDSDETQKSYIVYTDNSLDEMGNTKVFASTYDPTKRSSILGEIETEYEWEMIENLLDTLQTEVLEDLNAYLSDIYE